MITSSSYLKSGEWRSSKWDRGGEVKELAGWVHRLGMNRHWILQSYRDQGRSKFLDEDRSWEVIKLDQSLVVLCSFHMWGQNHDSRFAGVNDEKMKAQNIDYFLKIWLAKRKN